jgi:hypothetical protein
MRAYRDQVAQILREKVAETRQKNDALRRAAREEARADSIHRTREPLPIPTDEQAESCGGWIRNLDRCDEEQFALKTSLRETRGALEATSRLQALAEKQGEADSARADSAIRALGRQRAKDQILGIQLPSRRTSFAAGGVTVFVVCLLVRQPC